MLNTTDNTLLTKHKKIYVNFKCDKEFPIFTATKR